MPTDFAFASPFALRNSADAGGASGGGGGGGGGGGASGGGGGGGEGGSEGKSKRESRCSCSPLGLRLSNSAASVDARLGPHVQYIYM